MDSNEQIYSGTGKLLEFSALIVVAVRHTSWRLTRHKEVKQA